MKGDTSETHPLTGDELAAFLAHLESCDTDNCAECNSVLFSFPPSEEKP